MTLRNRCARATRRLPILAALLALSACGHPVAEVPPDPPVAPGGSPAQYTYEVVHVYPHDPEAFTQGLVFRDGDLLESTGLYGYSSFRDVELNTGRVLKEVTVPSQYFAEGLAVIGDKAYQLTWKSGVGFIYNVDTFEKLGEFLYDGEGWGLTTDGHLLVLSDGTSRIRFLDPADFHVVRTIDVTARGRPIDQLNELEWINGEIFSNVWQTDLVVRIDPATGAVRGEVNFLGLLPSSDRAPDTDVLNGIAYDSATGRLFVTGKKWPHIYEVRLRPKS